ncbi:MAG TPA: hypothetical protein VFU86_02245 [Terriglobales bacterium]|nr:hypothetical protein [Terriglobales bacterium]
MLRKWPIACLLCLTFVMAGLAIAGEPVSPSTAQTAVVTVLPSPALPVANPQRLSKAHISLKRSIGSALPAGSSSLPSLATNRHRDSNRIPQPLLTIRGVIDCRAPPSPRSV